MIPTTRRSVLSIVRESLPAEEREAILRSVAVGLTLAGRRIRNGKLRSLLFALSVAACVAVYILISAFQDATVGRAVSSINPLVLPADAMVTSQSIETKQLDAIDRIPQVKAVHSAIRIEALTQHGKQVVIGLRNAGSESVNLGEMVFGHMPSRPGEIALPASISHGYSRGSRFVILYMTDTGSLYSKDSLVSGVYRPVSPALSHVVVYYGDIPSEVRAEPNCALVTLSEKPLSQESRRRIREAMPGAETLTEETPLIRMSALTQGALSPSRTLALFVFTLAGLGILNLQLMSFLTRKRDFGILRAIGMDARDAGVVLLLEGLLLAGVGIVIGSLASFFVVQSLAGALPYRVTVTGQGVGRAAFFAVLTFCASTWMPVALSARATVDQLLHNRRVYLNPNPSCANCGRCGGF